MGCNYTVSIHLLQRTGQALEDLDADEDEDDVRAVDDYGGESDVEDLLQPPPKTPEPARPRAASPPHPGSQPIFVPEPAPVQNGPAVSESGDPKPSEKQTSTVVCSLVGT